MAVCVSQRKKEKEKRGVVNEIGEHMNSHPPTTTFCSVTAR